MPGALLGECGAAAACAGVEERLAGALLGVGGAPALGPGPLGVGVPGAVPVEPVAPAHAGIEGAAAVDEHFPGALLGVGGTCTVRAGVPGAGLPGPLLMEALLLGVGGTSALETRVPRAGVPGAGVPGAGVPGTLPTEPLTPACADVEDRAEHAGADEAVACAAVKTLSAGAAG